MMGGQTVCQPMLFQMVFLFKENIRFIEGGGEIPEKLQWAPCFIAL